MKSPAKIFHSRLHADTTLQQVKVFVEQQFSADAVDVLQLSVKFPESYSSFRTSISGVDVKVALNVDYWPEGALVKKFFLPNDKSLITSLP